ncbi:MAG: hypothetical protein K6G17_05935 [Oscillospiraceae bacterium]|nr:hypothetical protein [Oscillospiraceae bacterium]
MKNKTNLFDRIISSRLVLIIFSLLVSLIVWIYLASQDTVEFKKTFPGVRVELVGEDILRNARNMVVTDLDTNSITVEVVGPRRVVSALSSDQIVAQVDVSKLTQAAYTSQTYTVLFPDGTDASSLTTTNRTPETVNFMISSLTQKTVPVRGSFEGTVAVGFTSEQVEFDPSTVTVYGPEAYLKDVEYAWLTFGASQEVNSTYSADTGFSLRNKNNDECSTKGLTFSTDVVRATLPIMRVKEIPLDVNRIYGAGATEENTIITIEPASILLAGDSALLDNLNKIVIDTIDFTDFKFTDKRTNIPIRFDNELENLSGVSEATITVEIRDVEVKEFVVQNIRCLHVPEGYEAKAETAFITVTLRGPSSVMSEIRAENIHADVDLTDYTYSTTLTPKIVVDGFLNVDAILDVPSVTITVQKAETEETP